MNADADLAFIQDLNFTPLEGIKVDEERLGVFTALYLSIGALPGVLILDELVLWHLDMNEGCLVDVNYQILSQVRNLKHVVRAQIELRVRFENVHGH